MSGFQTTINQYPAPAVAGDFASANPRANVVTGPGAFVAAAANGCNIGVFGWADANGNVGNVASGNAPTGFVHRDMQGLITQWLGQAGMNIPSGLPVTLMSAGLPLTLKGAS